METAECAGVSPLIMLALIPYKIRAVRHRLRSRAEGSRKSAHTCAARQASADRSSGAVATGRHPSSTGLVRVSLLRLLQKEVRRCDANSGRVLAGLTPSNLYPRMQSGPRLGSRFSVSGAENTVNGGHQTQQAPSAIRSLFGVHASACPRPGNTVNGGHQTGRGRQYESLGPWDLTPPESAPSPQHAWLFSPTPKTRQPADPTSYGDLFKGPNRPRATTMATIPRPSNIPPLGSGIASTRLSSAQPLVGISTRSTPRKASPR